MVLAFIIGSGLVYGYIAANNRSLSVEPNPPIIAVTPSEELYEMALESVKKEKVDAQLCSMDFFRNSNDERVEYRASFGFRSPSNPDWYYSLSIVPDETIFGPRLRIRGHEYTEDTWLWFGCLAACRREPSKGYRNRQNDLILTKNVLQMNISKPT